MQSAVGGHQWNLDHFLEDRKQMGLNGQRNHRGQVVSEVWGNAGMERNPGSWEGQPSSWGLWKRCQTLSWWKGEVGMAGGLALRMAILRAIYAAAKPAAYPQSCHFLATGAQHLATCWAPSVMHLLFGGHSAGCLGGSRPPQMRVTPPEWGFLSFGPDGLWAVSCHPDLYPVTWSKQYKSTCSAYWYVLINVNGKARMARGL